MYWSILKIYYKIGLSRIIKDNPSQKVYDSVIASIINKNENNTN